MSIQCVALFLAAVAFVTPPSVSGEGLRSGGAHRLLKQVKADECTLLVRSSAPIVDMGAVEDTFECELDPSDADGISGISYPIDASTTQKDKLKKLLKSGELKSHQSTLKINGLAQIANGKLSIPPGLQVALGKKRNKARRLAIVEGDTPVLVVRVTDSEGRVYPDSATVVSDKVFGTDGDLVNLKSQMSACSFGKLNIVPGAIPRRKRAASGVIEVNIPISLNNTQWHVRNNITTAVQDKLGIQEMPGPYQHIMYLVEGCYRDCGWAAYAYVDHWNSVYQGVYYSMAMVQMHEIGHNLNLHHSGGLDGLEYTDWTCFMGNPCYTDDCRMCYNPAKSYQLGWYNDAGGIVTISPVLNCPTSVELVGIANYDIRNSQQVILKIETGTDTDQYVGFNRAIGINQDNGGTDVTKRAVFRDKVTVVQTGLNGAGFSLSYLNATLDATESFVYPNWAATGHDLAITAESIDLSSNPAVANVSLCLGSCTGPCTTTTTAAPPSTTTTTAGTTTTTTAGKTCTYTRRTSCRNNGCCWTDNACKAC